MKSNRIYFGLLVLALIIVTVWAAYNMLYSSKTKQIYAVSVIVNDSNNERWNAMREGMEQAASDYNIKLNIVSTDTRMSSEQQMEYIKGEINNGADGIITEPVSSDNMTDFVEKISSDTAVILLNTDIEPEGVYTTVMPDNDAIGQSIGQAVLNAGEDISGKSIGIVSGNQHQESMQQRLMGLKEILGSYSNNVSWTLSTSSGSVAEELMSYLQSQPVSIVVALGNTETEAAIDVALKKNSNGSPYSLYGEGYSEKAVYYLDKGIVKNLVVPNELNMGYLSVQAIARRLQHETNSAVNMKIDFLSVDKNNVYNIDNQKLLFPLVQ